MKKQGLSKANLGKDSHLLKNVGFFIIVAFFLYVKIFGSLFFPSSQITFASDLTPESILKAVNEQRALRNLVILNDNSKLTAAAQSKSDDMQARHYFSHVDPDGHYIWDKIVALGYTPYLQLGENLAIEFYDTESLVSAWMNSPTHRENILQEGFQDQGMGLAFGDSGQGQYHSAITNTFGALAHSALPKTTKPAAKPKTQATEPVPAPSPPNEVPPAQPLPAPSPVPAPAPVSVQTPTQIAPRGGRQLAVNNPDANFTVPQKQPAPAKTPSKPYEQAPSPTQAVIGVLNPSPQTNDGINRYLILVSGAALLLLMLFDIKKVVEKKLGSLDKKINNFVILLISLIVIGFIYWL